VKAIYAAPEPPSSAEGFTVKGTVTEVVDELAQGGFVVGGALPNEGIGFDSVSTIQEFVLGERGNTDALMENPGIVKFETLIQFGPLVTA
jgi:hypothetical protein